MVEEAQTAEIAKEAYVLARQIDGIEEEMNRSGAQNGYSSFATSFNTILEKAKKVLHLDPTIFSTIEHLTPYKPDAINMRERVFSFHELKGSLPILKAALQSFFDFHFPNEEKKKIGF